MPANVRTGRFEVSRTARLQESMPFITGTVREKTTVSLTPSPLGEKYPVLTVMVMGVAMVLMMMLSTCLTVLLPARSRLEMVNV